MKTKIKFLYVFLCPLGGALIGYGVREDDIFVALLGGLFALAAGHLYALFSR